MANPVSIDSRLDALALGARDKRMAEQGGRPPNSPPPSGIEARVARLEASLSHVEADVHEIRGDLKELRRENQSSAKELRRDAQTDFRLMFGTLVSVALGLSGIMAKGFGWL